MVNALHIDAGAELNIVHAAELRQIWLEQIGLGDATVSIDLGGVQEMDSAGAQLLIALDKALQRDGRKLEFLRPSRVVREVLDTFGLTDRLAVSGTH